MKKSNKGFILGCILILIAIICIINAKDSWLLTGLFFLFFFGGITTILCYPIPTREYYENDDEDIFPPTL